MLMERRESAISRVAYIKTGYPLIESSSLKTKGKAGFYVEPRNINELMEAMELAYSRKIQLYIIGSGTHTLISDNLDNAMVISTRSMRGIMMKGTLLECYPGEMLDSIIDKAIEHQLIGLEKLAGIPGTIGGAMICNAESEGLRISDLAYYFDYLTLNGNLRRQRVYTDTFSRQQLDMEENGIITNIALRLNPSKATAEARIRKKLLVELEYIPPCTNYLGQVFKDTNQYKAEEIIRKIGLDKEDGIAQFSEYQPNTIVTMPGYSTKDIYNLIVKAEMLANDILGIKLERSVSLIGQF